MRRRTVIVCMSLVCLLLLLTALVHAQTISFVGKFTDKTNYSNTGLNFGTAGYWFPQFNAASPVMGRPTDENHRIALPSWASMNFTTNPADPNRTFSLDNGGVKTEGGKAQWNTFTLPSGEVGLSGSTADPQTMNNSNNSINKILLVGSVPQAFLLHIVVDNTAGEHDPVTRIRPRGEGPTTADTGVQLNPGAAAFNGTADVYTFKYVGWKANDFIKLQLNSGNASKMAGIAGLMFDVVPEPVCIWLAVTGVAGLNFVMRRRHR